MVELSAIRPLALVGDKRFRPDGPWAAQALVHTLAPAAVAAHSWSRRSTSSVSAAAAGQSRLVQDSLEVLPEPLRRLTAGGPPAASLLWDHGDPSTTWLVRYLANRLDASPEGFDLDLAAAASALVLDFTRTLRSDFTRTLEGSLRSAGGGGQIRRLPFHPDIPRACPRRAAISP